MRSITKKQRHMAAVAAAWIDKGGPDLFARCFKRGRYWLTNMKKDGEPHTGLLRVITHDELIDIYEKLKKTNPEEIAEIEREMI